MTDVIYAVAAIILGAWVILVWLPGWALNSCIIAIVLVAYSSGYLQTFAPVRLFILFFAFALLGVLLFTRHHFLNGKEKMIISSTLTLLVSVFGVMQAFVDADAMDPLLRYVLVFPLTCVAGFVLAKSNDLFRVAKVYVLVSLLMGALAIFERVSGSFIVAGAYENSGRLIRDGSIRSIVFAEHPLVLSVLLLAAVPLVNLSMQRSTLRTLTYLVLVGGVVATNSRGALIILAAWLVLKAAGKLGILKSGASRLARIGVFVAMLTAFLGMIFGSSADELSSSTAIDASAEYRSSLYSFAVRSLSEMPGGWGLNGLPEGVYFVPSYFGTLDISKTVDSELALAIFDFGWFGLIAFVALMVIQLGARNINSSIGQSGIIVTMSGFYLALHAWVGLGTIWMLMVGLTLGATRMGQSMEVSPEPPVGQLAKISETRQSRRP